MSLAKLVFASAVSFSIAATSIQAGVCPAEPPLQNWTGGGTVSCPCFAAGEEAGSVFNPPAEHFPIEILSIGVGYGSQFGGGPTTLEQSIHVYGAGLPNPGVPIFSLDGPQLADGVINEFDIDALLGSVIVNSAPFTITLEFFEANAGDGFHGTAVHDGNGCQAGRNVIFTDLGTWNDACALGITGDWIFTVTYRSVSCAAAAPSGAVPNGDGIPAPLTIDKFGTNLLFSWSASCSLDDTDFEIYEGQIGNYTSHIAKLCSTGGANASIVLPAAASSYYLIVPKNAESEGSYGLDSSGAERPAGGMACMNQLTGACP